MADRAWRPDGPVLGVSADFHDAAAALVVDGAVVAAAEEERFTRRKHEPSLPVNAMAWCLEFADLAPGDLGAVVFHEKPFTAYERLLATHARVGPRGFRQLSAAVRSWTRSKLWIAARIERALATIGPGRPPVRFCEHHLSHAAAAFLPSPFDRAAILTVDGVGEWATTSIGVGGPDGVRLVEELRFPDSLGLFYSALTAQCGFEVNDGEYKLMGLAPYGRREYLEQLRSVCRIGDDGSVHLDQRYFSFRSGRRMGSARLDELLGGPPRSAGAPLEQRHADLAASCQALIEEAMERLARRARETTGEDHLCLAGGVALNCVAVRRLTEAGGAGPVWVQPAAGDAGSALGAALWGWSLVGEPPRRSAAPDGMSGAALGPGYGADAVAEWLTSAGVDSLRLPDAEERCRLVADRIAEGAVVGWFEGRMEFGPRALGHRSILADPRDPGAVVRINERVKGREGFRPFAPSVLAERAAEIFDLEGERPYMTVTAGVRSAGAPVGGGASFAERLASVRSDLPACTHVDGSARVQTVDPERHPAFHRLLVAFERRTGCPVLLNTSFNRAGEPIVRTPADALACARAARLDLLVLEESVVTHPAAGGS
ncbi:MAG: carbamoyltransferase [Microthrixaceae bacterium]